MKAKQIYRILVLLALPVLAYTQSRVQGIGLRSSFIYLRSSKEINLFCNNSENNHCQLKAINTYAAEVYYWRRTRPGSSPLYIQGELGLRYLPTEIKEFSFTTDIDTPSIVIDEYRTSMKTKSVYGHVALVGGYHFRIKDIPMEAYAGVTSNLAIFGKRHYYTKEKDYFKFEIVDDTSCQCQIIQRIPLNEPFDTVISDWGRRSYLDTRFHAGGVLGLNFELPTKGNHNIKLGYQYEKVLSKPDFHSIVINGYHSLTFTVGLGKNYEPLPEPKHEKVNRYRGFALGTQMGLQQYDDGYTKNLLSYNFNFGYSTALGICPEILITSYHKWSGEEMGGLSIGAGLAFEMLNGYLVPNFGGILGIYAPWADDQYRKLSGVYAGAGLQYPNTGRLRARVSTLAHLWFGRRNSAFDPMSFDLGAFYFFGKQMQKI